jgi:uracil-DNA glycosylase
VIGNIRVPNEGPKNARLYLVGEGPGADEVDARRPFVGVSGLKLRNCLGRNGVAEDSIRLANLVQYRPPNNKFEAILRTSELAAGIEELASDIREFRPNVVAALGNWPLYYLTGRRGKKSPGTGIGKWRGSILPCTLPGCEGVKVIASYHPAFVVRQPTAYPIFDTDIKRIVGDSLFPELRWPEHDIIVDPRGNALDEWVERLCSAEYLAVDIETVKRSHHILCVGFSPDPLTAVVIPHSSTDFSRYDAISRVLSSQARKVFHNGGTFDVPILVAAGHTVRNFYWDTMAAQHVMWPELPKSLEYLSSVYTRQPYYKTAGRAEIPDDAKGWSDKFDRGALYEYNGTDCCVTAAVFVEQCREFDEGPPQWNKVFRFEMAQYPVAAEISRTGLTIDIQRKETLRRALQAKWAVVQFVLNNLVKLKVNVNSPKQMRHLLYDKDKLGFPPRKDHQGNLTTDEDAIVSLIAFAKDKLAKLKPGGNANAYWQLRLDALSAVLIIRGVRKLLSSYINIRLSDDGKLRATFKPVSTETGRWACAVYFDGTGTNAQTFPREVFELKNYEDDPFMKELLPYVMEAEAEDVGIELDETVETEEAVAV